MCENLHATEWDATNETTHNTRPQDGQESQTHGNTRETTQLPHSHTPHVCHVTVTGVWWTAGHPPAAPAGKAVLCVGDREIGYMDELDQTETP